MTAKGHTGRRDADAFPYSVLHLFSEAGGISTGLRLAGCRVVAGSDSDPDAAATHALNLPEATVALATSTNPTDDGILLVCRSAPCIPSNRRASIPFGMLWLSV